MNLELQTVVAYAAAVIFYWMHWKLDALQLDAGWSEFYNYGEDKTMTAAVLDPIRTEQSSLVLCCYLNATSQIQIVRISDVPNWYFERVVFPGERLLFESPTTAHLEVHTGTPSVILADRIACQFLRVRDGGGERASSL